MKVNWVKRNAILIAVLTLVIVTGLLIVFRDRVFGYGKDDNLTNQNSTNVYVLNAPFATTEPGAEPAKNNVTFTYSGSNQKGVTPENVYEPTCSYVPTINGGKGTKNNPFVVLEVVPDKSMQELTYLTTDEVEEINIPEVTVKGTPAPSGSGSKPNYTVNVEKNYANFTALGARMISKANTADKCFWNMPDNLEWQNVAGFGMKWYSHSANNSYTYKVYPLNKDDNKKKTDEVKLNDAAKIYELTITDQDIEKAKASVSDTTRAAEFTKEKFKKAYDEIQKLGVNQTPNGDSENREDKLRKFIDTYWELFDKDDSGETIIDDAKLDEKDWKLLESKEITVYAESASSSKKNNDEGKIEKKSVDKGVSASGKAQTTISFGSGSGYILAVKPGKGYFGFKDVNDFNNHIFSTDVDETAKRWIYVPTRDLLKKFFDGGEYADMTDGIVSRTVSSAYTGFWLAKYHDIDSNSVDDKVPVAGKPSPDIIGWEDFASIFNTYNKSDMLTGLCFNYNDNSDGQINAMSTSFTIVHGDAPYIFSGSGSATSAPTAAPTSTATPTKSPEATETPASTTPEVTEEPTPEKTTEPTAEPTPEKTTEPTPEKTAEPTPTPSGAQSRVRAYTFQFYGFRQNEVLKRSILDFSSKEEMDNFHFKVIVITPAELNALEEMYPDSDDKIDLIERADMYYFHTFRSAKVVANEAKKYYNFYHQIVKNDGSSGISDDGVKAIPSFTENDLEWSLCMKLIKRISDTRNQTIPLMMTSTMGAIQYEGIDQNGGYVTHMYMHSNKKGGNTKTNEGFPGNINNIAKLYLVTAQFDLMAQPDSTKYDRTFMADIYPFISTVDMNYDAPNALIGTARKTGFCPGFRMMDPETSTKKYMDRKLCEGSQTEQYKQRALYFWNVATFFPWEQGINMESSVNSYMDQYIRNGYLKSYVSSWEQLFNPGNGDKSKTIKGSDGEDDQNVTFVVQSNDTTGGRASLLSDDYGQGAVVPNDMLEIAYKIINNSKGSANNMTLSVEKNKKTYTKISNRQILIDYTNKASYSKVSESNDVPIYVHVRISNPASNLESGVIRSVKISDGSSTKDVKVYAYDSTTGGMGAELQPGPVTDSKGSSVNGYAVSSGQTLEFYIGYSLKNYLNKYKDIKIDTLAKNLSKTNLIVTAQNTYTIEVDEKELFKLE